MQIFGLMDRMIHFLSACFADWWLTECLPGDLLSFLIWFIFYPFKVMVSLHLTARLQCDFKFEIESSEMRHRGLRSFIAVRIRTVVLWVMMPNIQVHG